MRHSETVGGALVNMGDGGFTLNRGAVIDIRYRVITFERNTFAAQLVIGRHALNRCRATG